MSIAAILSAIRLVSAALIACAFLVAPMAEAEHVQIDTASACDMGHVDEKSDDGDSNQGEHDHHAHNCGPCLQHLLRKDWVQDSFICASEGAHIPLLSVSLVSQPPGSLYRPPRA
jgi:hypothetical protein